MLKRESAWQVLIRKGMRNGESEAEEKRLGSMSPSTRYMLLVVDRRW